MLAFIDESGDAGLDLSRGSSPFFVIALVLFEDTLEAERADEAISALRYQLRLHPHYEFAFNKMSRSLRTSFLEAMASHKFGHFAVVVDKARLGGKAEARMKSIYPQALGLLIEVMRPYLEEATIVIDGLGSRRFKSALSRQVRGILNEGRLRVRRIKLQESHSNNLLQLADSVAGVVAREVSRREEGGRYAAVLRQHEVSVANLGG